MTSTTTLLRAMWISFRRDRAALFFTTVFPLLFLVVFGAFFRDVGASKSDLVITSPVPLLDQALSADPGLAKIISVTTVDSEAAALDRVAKGKSDAYVSQTGTDLTLRYSAADQVKSGVVQGVVAQIVQSANLAASGRAPTYRMTASQVEDDSLSPIQFLAPGLLGWAIASAGVFGASQTFVNWRTKGLLRRMRLAPINVSSMFTARVVLGLVIGLVQLVLFLAVAQIPFFGLQLRGSWWLAVPTMMAGTLAFLAIGVLIGGLAKTQDSANSIAQLVVMPMAFLGGSFFPLDEAPAWMQAASRIFPLRYLNDGLVNVIGRGRGVDGVASQVAVLVVIALVVGVVALRLFRWER